MLCYTKPTVRIELTTSWLQIRGSTIELCRRGLMPIKHVPHSCGGCGKETTNPKYCSLVCQRTEHRAKLIAAGVASAQVIRTFLLKLNPTCACCRLATWLDKPIPLELDHIDGNANNQAMENLRLLCPNCHAQTPTYKGKNKGKGRHHRRERYAKGQSY